MSDNFDFYYSNYKNYFGDLPENILVKFVRHLSPESRVLDIGAGQGRNSIFLAESGLLVDTIDSSQSAVDTLQNIAHKNIRCWHADISDFNSKSNYYSAILLFGIVQILTYNEIKKLFNNIDSWLQKGGLIFITAFGSEDPSYQNCLNNWTNLGNNSFKNSDGRIRTFFDSDKILSFFKNYEILHKWEGLGKEHRHGNGPMEQHSMIELVIKKIC